MLGLGPDRVAGLLQLRIEGHALLLTLSELHWLASDSFKGQTHKVGRVVFCGLLLVLGLEAVDDLLDLSSAESHLVFQNVLQIGSQKEAVLDSVVVLLQP